MKDLNKTFSTITEHTIPNTLVILDCDETILKFEGELREIYKWWKETFNKFFEECQDFDLAEYKTNELWKKKIRDCDKFSHTDESGLTKMIEEAREVGNVVIIVTARDDELAIITKKHLNEIGFVADELKLKSDISAHHENNGIFHTSGKSKGKVADEICKELGFKNIVFVDDMLFNLEDVENICSKDYKVFAYRADFVEKN